MACLLALAVHLVGYRVVGKISLPSAIAEAFTNGPKYKTSPLKPAQIENYRRGLLQLMEEEKLYLDPDLKILNLAARMGIPSHHLSQVLSEGLQASFYDFINSYRVNAAKQRLKDPKLRHYSILAIGLESGFANKTTFNRTFKKLVGMTPSQFMAREAASL